MSKSDVIHLMLIMWTESSKIDNLKKAIDFSEKEYDKFTSSNE